MTALIQLILIVLVGYYAVETYFRYRETTGTRWERLIKAASNSATILWGKFVLVLSAIVSQLDNIADLLGRPEMKDNIQTLIGNPKAVALVMAGVAVISMIARFRTLK